MIGAYTIGKKAATFGYRRYGVPGAIASGAVALAGYVAVRRALQSATDGDDAALDDAIDAESIKAAVDEGGLGAVTDVGTLDEAIDADELREAVDVGEVQSSVTDEVDDVAGDPSRDE